MQWKEQEFSKNFDLSTWRKLFSFIKPYNKYMIILAVVMVLNAAADAVFPIFTKYAIDNFVVPANTEGVTGFSLLFLSVICFQAVNIFILIVLAGKIEVGVSYDIRKKAFQKLQELSYSYYDKTPIGWIMSRVTSDCERLSETLAWGIVDMFWGFAMMFGIVIIMLVLNWKLAIITLSVMPFLVLVSIWFQKRILKNYRKVRKINSQITGAINEGITGAITSKSLVCEDKNFEDYKKLTASMKKTSIRSAVLSSLYMPIALTLCSIGTSLVLWRGGNTLIAGAITYGTLIAFIQYSVQFFDPILELARMFSEIQGAQAAAERLVGLLNTEVEIKDLVKILPKSDLIHSPESEDFVQFLGKIEFKNVSFQYKQGEKVLENFNFKIEAGQSVALIGETGSGKTTLVNLICRFYEPQSGSILIDGSDVKCRSLHWLRSNIGYVLQNPHLFSGTIKENIRYGNLNAGDDEIHKAAKIVEADEFIVSLENGFDTRVGEGGNSLSTGQKQLISFARAIIADPKLFILDEATSSIDTEMEKTIQKAIKKILKNRTSIIIAHRLSTITDADLIVVLKQGKIVETGNHYTLLNNKNYYYNLYTKQFENELDRTIEDVS